MQSMILVLHVIIAAVLVGAVLVQRSEGGALGLGGGGSGGIISGRGAADMMVNITSIVGGLFFLTSIVLAVMAAHRPADRSIISDTPSRPGITLTAPPALRPAAPVPAAPVAPATTAPASAETAAEKAVKGATRAGPLQEVEAPPPAAQKASVKTGAPVAGRPLVGAASAPGTPAGSASPAVGAALPKKPAGPAKALSAAPLIPLSDAPAPALSGESPQGAPPAPADRQHTGPDQ